MAVHQHRRTVANAPVAGGYEDAVVDQAPQCDATVRRDVCPVDEVMEADRSADRFDVSQCFLVVVFLAISACAQDVERVLDVVLRYIAVGVDCPAVCKRLQVLGFDQRHHLSKAGTLLGQRIHTNLRPNRNCLTAAVDKPDPEVKRVLMIAAVEPFVRHDWPLVPHGHDVAIGEQAIEDFALEVALDTTFAAVDD